MIFVNSNVLPHTAAQGNVLPGPRACCLASETHNACCLNTQRSTSINRAASHRFALRVCTRTSNRENARWNVRMRRHPFFLYVMSRGFAVFLESVLPQSNVPPQEMADGCVHAHMRQERMRGSTHDEAACIWAAGNFSACSLGQEPSHEESWLLGKLRFIRESCT